jgi:hypothetical protein
MASVHQEPLLERHRFCHHHMARIEKQMSDEADLRQDCPCDDVTPGYVQNSSAEGAWQRGTFLGKRYFLSDK